MTSRYESINCPRCGSLLEPRVTSNCESIVHPADKELVRRGISIMPHIDVDYTCSCGFARHITLSCNGRKISGSDIFV